MPSKNTIYVQVPSAAYMPDQTMGYALMPNGDVFGILGIPTAQAHSITGANPLTFIQGAYPSYKVDWAEHDAGTYTPRFYRGTWATHNWPGMHPPMSNAQANEFTTATEQEDILSGDLVELARVVSPDPTTRHAYGSKIRNLLISACTEVESQMKGILKANGYKPTGNFTTNDYIKLCGPLRLEEYALRLTHYRDYGEIRPFQAWDSKHPTVSLAWYDAYNATKHDRELSFNRGALEHAISAVGALLILLAAQYGPERARPFRDSFFTFGSRPEWDHKDRTYAPPPGASWNAALHAF